MSAVLQAERPGGMLHRIASRPGPLLVAVTVMSWGAVGIALVTQHVFDMQPCPWCVLMRLIFIAIGAVTLLGALAPAVAARRGAATFGLALVASGLAAAFWHYFVASNSPSCNLTLAERIVGWTTLDQLLPAVFEPRASCADANISLLGIPYPLCAAIVYAASAIVLVRAFAVASAAR